MNQNVTPDDMDDIMDVLDPIGGMDEAKGNEIDFSNPLDEEEDIKDISYSYSTSVAAKKNPGREKAKFTLILEGFQAKKGKHPKKEFFNAFIIRAIKRAIRYMIAQKTPKTTCIAVNNTLTNEANIWNKLSDIYRQDVDLMKRISQTESGPLTDGKAKRDLSQDSKNEKSFNNPFCKAFFSNSLIREAFVTIIDLIYTNANSQKLCDKFKFSCCLTRMHNEDCENKWIRLKEYFKEDYFVEMEVLPKQLDSELMEIDVAEFNLSNPDFFIED